MKLKLLILLSPFVLYGTGYLIINLFNLTGVCIGQVVTLDSQMECWETYGDFAWPLKNFATYLFPVASLLFFSTKETVNLWVQKFAFFALPIGIILFTISNNSRTLWPFIPDSVTFSVWFGALFFVISTLIIFYRNLVRK